MDIEKLCKPTRQEFLSTMTAGVPAICSLLSISTGTWQNYKSSILSFYRVSEQEWSCVVRAIKHKVIAKMTSNGNPALDPGVRAKISSARKDSIIRARYNKSRESERIQRQLSVLERESRAAHVKLSVKASDLLPLKPLPQRQFSAICLICGYHFEWKVTTNCSARHCPKCSARSCYRSVRENYFESLFERLGYKAYHAQHLLDGYEADLFLPELGLVLEFNGTRYHSYTKAIKGEPKHYLYHSEKSNIAQKHGWILFHFWEDDSEDFIKMVLSPLIPELEYEESLVCPGKIQQECDTRKLVNRDTEPFYSSSWNNCVSVDFGRGYFCSNSGVTAEDV